MQITGFYEFRTGTRGEPEVTTLVGVIPVIPVNGEGDPDPKALPEDMDPALLVYHLFHSQRDPFCAVMPARRFIRGG